MDFQGSVVRPANISDGKNPKRRRLNKNSFEEVLSYPHAVSSLAHEQHEYSGFAARPEEEGHADGDPPCESDVNASKAITEEDGWAECCYGMVCSCINLYNMILLITFSSCLISMCGSDIPQTSRSPNCPPTFQ
jgi:hypothetical protein